MCVKSIIIMKYSFGLNGRNQPILNWIECMMRNLPVCWTWHHSLWPPWTPSPCPRSTRKEHAGQLSHQTSAENNFFKVIYMQYATLRLRLRSLNLFLFCRVSSIITRLFCYITCTFKCKSLRLFRFKISQFVPLWIKHLHLKVHFT